MTAAIRFLDVWSLPTLTIPFVATTHVFLLALRRFESFQPLGSSNTAQTEAFSRVMTLSDATNGVVSGVAQVFFQSNTITGALFIGAVFISSRLSCTMAIVGSAVGALTGFLMGAPASSIELGLLGFNSTLTAIALGGVFLTPSYRAAGFTFFGVIATIIFQATLDVALKPLDLPAMTLPFVLVTWIFLLASPLFHGLTKKLKPE